MTSNRRIRLAQALILVLVGAIVGCSQGDTVVIKPNGPGSITVSVIPGQGTQTPGGSSAPPARPGNGGSGDTNPSVPPATPPPDPPPGTVDNPNNPPPPAGSGATKRQNIEKEYELKIIGKDANNDAYLDTVAYALSRYPKGAHKGLTVEIDIQSLQTTGGVGGYWTIQKGAPYLRVYQAGKEWVHVIVHELAHNHDLWTNQKRVTPDMLDAGKEGGTYPSENIPSPYGKYGLNNPSKNPEYAAEVVSWSLDMTSLPGFAPYPYWKPRQKLVDRLGKYLERDKIIWNQKN